MYAIYAIAPVVRNITMYWLQNGSAHDGRFQSNILGIVCRAGLHFGMIDDSSAKQRHLLPPKPSLHLEVQSKLELCGHIHQHQSTHAPSFLAIMQ